MEVPTPIAVVGVACRFCGDVDSPERLWRMCAEARSGWSRIPPSRFNLEGVYHQYHDKAGTVRGDARAYLLSVCIADHGA